MQADLLSDDGGTRATAFEDAILMALGRERIDVDLDRMARAYRRLSDALTQDVEAPSAELASDPEAWAVFGLIYGARTFHAAHRVLNAYPPGPGPVVELGAGWGPFALHAALERRRAVTLVDTSRAMLDQASRLFSVVGLDAPATAADDLTRFRTSGAGAIAIPFALNELADRDDPRALRRRVELWVSMLSDTGRLYLMEPGTPRSARRLQTLRDHLPAGIHVHAPCSGATACPLLQRATDWCHFTWRLEPGPLGRAIADHAKRRWQEQHVSFLVLGQQPRETSGLRVLDLRPHGRAKVVARTCGPEGLVPLTALRRDAAYAVLSDLEPGALVRIQSGEQKGDGIRLSEPDEVVLLQQI